MFGTACTLVKNSIHAFIGDEALTRGAAIAFYSPMPAGARNSVSMRWSQLGCSAGFGVADVMLGVKFNAEPGNQVELGF